MKRAFIPLSVFGLAAGLLLSTPSSGQAGVMAVTQSNLQLNASSLLETVQYRRRGCYRRCARWGWGYYGRYCVRWRWVCPRRRYYY